MRRVLLVSSEAVPFIKTGGLADVVGTLPKYIDKKKYDVRVIIPKYHCMSAEFLPQLKFVCHFYVSLNWRRQYVGILQAQSNGITYYFVDNEFYFAGNVLYNNIYEDVEKFAYFSKAVLEALPHIDFKPDIIHCNDWQTGLLPVFLKTTYGSDDYYANMRTVYSIHNLKFQGRWRIKEVADITGLPEHIFNSNELEAYGEANCLKGGVVYANAISTVSPTYADEITTPEGGEGLHGLMNARRDSLYGILNGIDYEEYNPMTDRYIPEHFNVINCVEAKAKNKKALQEKWNLQVRPDTMLIGIVSRLTDQKGMDLIAYVMDQMLSDMDIQFVVLGTGENQYEGMFNYFQRKYPGKLSVYIGYSEEKAHEIYACADALLMPSLFEPCGLSQMMAMRYGTLPIVRETGGLKDTVIPFNEYANTGTGFSFTNYNAHDMMHVIAYAASVYKNNQKAWEALMVRAMNQDFSWDESARKYENLYAKLLEDIID